MTNRDRKCINDFPSVRLQLNPPLTSSTETKGLLPSIPSSAGILNSYNVEPPSHVLPPCPTFSSGMAISVLTRRLGACCPPYMSSRGCRP